MKILLIKGFATSETADFPIESQACEGDVDCRATGDVEEVFRREGFPSAETLDPRNYLVPHRLHGFKTLCRLRKNVLIFLNAGSPHPAYRNAIEEFAATGLHELTYRQLDQAAQRRQTFRAAADAQRIADSLKHARGADSPVAQLGDYS
jgi:hypothetical protein